MKVEISLSFKNEGYLTLKKIIFFTTSFTIFQPPKENSANNRQYINFQISPSLASYNSLLTRYIVGIVLLFVSP